MDRLEKCSWHVIASLIYGLTRELRKKSTFDSTCAIFHVTAVFFLSP